MMGSLQSPKCLTNLKNNVRKRKIGKLRRLITYWHYPPSIRKRHLYKSEYYMDESQIEAYIESMAEHVADDPKVANCLLKLWDLKKKYSRDDEEDISLATLKISS